MRTSHSGAGFADFTRWHASRLQEVSKNSDFWDDFWLPFRPPPRRKAMPLLALGVLLVAGGGYGIAEMVKVSFEPHVSLIESALSAGAFSTPFIAIILAGLFILAETVWRLNVDADAPNVPRFVEDWHREVRAAPATLRGLGVPEGHIAEVEERNVAADQLREQLGAVFVSSRARELHEHPILVELRGVAAEVGAFIDVAREQHAGLEAAVTRHVSGRPLADVAADHVAETAALLELLSVT